MKPKYTVVEFPTSVAETARELVNARYPRSMPFREDGFVFVKTTSKGAQYLRGIQDFCAALDEGRRNDDRYDR